MTESFVTGALTEGCISWDVVVHKVLSVVLMQSLDTRAGEIARSNHCTGSEYLAWKDVTLTVVGEAQVGKIEASILIRIEKGSKQVTKSSLSMLIHNLKWIQPILDKTVQ